MFHLPPQMPTVHLTIVLLDFSLMTNLKIYIGVQMPKRYILRIY